MLWLNPILGFLSTTWALRPWIRLLYYCKSYNRSIMVRVLSAIQCDDGGASSSTGGSDSLLCGWSMHINADCTTSRTELGIDRSCAVSTRSRSASTRIALSRSRHSLFDHNSADVWQSIWIGYSFTVRTVQRRVDMCRCRQNDRRSCSSQTEVCVIIVSRVGRWKWREFGSYLRLKFFFALTVNLCFSDA